MTRGAWLYVMIMLSDTLALPLSRITTGIGRIAVLPAKNVPGAGVGHLGSWKVQVPNWAPAPAMPFPAFAISRFRMNWVKSPVVCASDAPTAVRL